MNFNNQAAFFCNIGWVTEQEQTTLRNKRIATASMGRFGGFHLLPLARLDVGKSNIADLDTLDLANFNRQAGASLISIGRHKVKCSPNSPCEAI